MNRICLFKTVLMTSALGMSGAAAAQDVESSAEETAPVLADAQDATGDTIFVTARRRQEDLQDVPVAVTAFDAAALERSSVQSVQDLTSITPGLRFGVEGGKTSAAVSLRGIGQTPVGGGTPGVVQYFADVRYCCPVCADRYRGGRQPRKFKSLASLVS